MRVYLRNLIAGFVAVFLCVVAPLGCLRQGVGSHVGVRNAGRARGNRHEVGGSSH